MPQGSLRSTSAALVILALAASSCGSGGAAAPEGEPGAPAAVPVEVDPGGDAVEPARSTLRVALVNDPRSLDPREVLDAEGDLVVRALFDGLVDVLPDGGVGPAAARSWSVEEDGLVHRFHLREDRFHDGTRVTAQHHADAIAAALDPARPPFGREVLLASIAGVEVIDARELVVRTVRPDPLLLHRLADPALAPLPAVAVTDPEGFARQPVGNGPFRMLGPREPGEFIRLGAWREHPQPPRIDELVLQVVTADPDGARRWGDLEEGRLQIAPIPATRRDDARERFGTPLDGRRGPGLHELPLVRTYGYAFATGTPPTDDVLLRRAISAAIDRDALARELVTTGVEAAPTILPGVVGGRLPSCAHCQRDVALARQLVQEWRATLEEGAVEPVLSLTYPRGEGHVTIAERVASDIEQVLGLDVRLQARDVGTLLRMVEEGRAPLFRLGLSAPVGGAGAGPGLLEVSFASWSPENRVGWADAATDEALAGWSVASPVEVVRAIEQRLLEEAVVVPLLWARPDLVVTDDVGGFHMDPTGRWWPELVFLR